MVLIFGVILLSAHQFVRFQIQFRSQRLDGYMFKVVDGKVEEVKSIFGQKFYSRNGRSGVITDTAVQVPHKQEDSLAVPTGRALNPKGYM